MPIKKKEEQALPEFNSDFKLSPEEAVALGTMVSSPAFRIFEKYLSNKQNKKAHMMVSANETEKMLELRAQIKALGEITGDMKILWDIANRKINEVPTSKE